MDIDTSTAGVLSAAGGIITALWFAWRDSLKQKDDLHKTVIDGQRGDLKGLYDATHAIADASALIVKITMFMEQHGKVSEALANDLEKLHHKLDEVRDALNLQAKKNG